MTAAKQKELENVIPLQTKTTAPFKGLEFTDEELEEFSKFKSDTRLKAAPKKFANTDIGNSQRLAHYLKGEVLFVCAKDSKKGAGSWLAWDGKRWAADYQAVVDKYKEVVEKKIPLEFESQDEDWIAFLKWVNKSASASSIRAAIELAASDDQIREYPESFDKKPKYLNCLNGCLNLETGKLEDFNPDHRSTKIANFNYRQELLEDANTGKYRWNSFIQEVLPDEATREYVLLCIGKAITGIIENPKLLFLKGGGRNGKGVFVKTISKLLDSYHATAHINLFCSVQKAATDVERSSPMLRSLVGARLVTAEEPERGSRWHESVIKMVLSGNTPFLTRGNYESAISAEPFPLIIVSSNFHPKTRDMGHSFFRRYVEIPFNQQFSKPDLTLEDRLLSELEQDYIGTSLCQKAMQYQKDLSKLDELPEAAKAANDKYRLNNDSFSAWLNETRERCSGVSELAKEAYEDYKVYCDGQGLDCESFTDFKDKIMENGYILSKGRANALFIRNIAKKADQGDPDDQL
jgi:P4 family phage/plasmid primase-like protien